MFRNRIFVAALALACTVLGASALTGEVSAQGANDPSSGQTESKSVQGSAGESILSTSGEQFTSAELMQRQAASPPPGPRPEHKLEYPDRSNLPQQPGARALSRFPTGGSDLVVSSPTLNIHTTSQS